MSELTPGQPTGRRRLIVHVGPTKTGTSAVQNYLRGHDNSVVIYPKIGLWPDGSHHTLMFNHYATFPRPDIARIDAPAALQAIVDEARGGRGNIVLSSEFLTSVDPGDIAGALLARLEGEWTAELVFVCREHFARAASLYNQRVKDFVFAERSTPGDYMQQHAQGLIYAPLLRRLAAGGLPLRVLSYHPAASFAARFLAFVGLAPGLAVEPRNISMSVKGLIATLAANNVAGAQADRERCFAALRRMRNFYGPSRFIFDQATVAEIGEPFAKDRRDVDDLFQVELPPPEVPPEHDDQFRLAGSELDEIRAATAELGGTGDAIVAFANAYVRR